MLASWSDSKIESDKEYNIIAFVAYVDAGLDETKDWDDETVIEKYQELYQDSLKIKKQNDVLKEKVKILESKKTKTENDFQSQVTELEKQLDSMVQKVQQLRDRISDQNKLITSPSTERHTPKYQLHESQRKIHRLTIGAEKIDKMLNMCKPSGNRYGLGYVSNSSLSSSVTKFVKGTNMNIAGSKAYACGEKGYIRPLCDKRDMSYGKSTSGNLQSQLANLLKEVGRLSK